MPGTQRPSLGGVAVDLNAVLLKPAIHSPMDAVTRTVHADETTTWYVVGDDGGFRKTGELPADVEVALLVRTPETKEPAWHVLLRDHLDVERFGAACGESSGAILFVRTAGERAEHFVAWCFGFGALWMRRQATSPRFGLLVALNAMADEANTAAPADIGVVGASVATRAGNLRRATLTAAVPAVAAGIPRIDTLSDVLMGARVRTGHDVLGRVSAGGSLHFPAIVGSVEDFRALSSLVLRFATQDNYRRSHGWIDYTVPESDEEIVYAVLDSIWRSTDEDGQWEGI